MTTHHHERPVTVTLWAGLVLTILTIIMPFIQGDTIADHIRAGYPDYSNGRIDTAVTTYQIYLSVVGALGVASWLGALWAVRTDKPWTRWAATGMFILGSTIALTNLFIKDTSGDTGLPMQVGLVGMVPCLAGLLAVALLWRRS